MGLLLAHKALRSAPALSWKIHASFWFLRTLLDVPALSWKPKLKKKLYVSHPRIQDPGGVGGQAKHPVFQKGIATYLSYSRVALVR